MICWVGAIILPSSEGRFYALKGVIRDDEMVLPEGFVIESITELEVPELDEQRHLVKVSIKVAFCQNILSLER